jgi:hypothetical protein
MRKEIGMKRFEDRGAIKESKWISDGLSAAGKIVRVK